MSEGARIIDVRAAVLQDNDKLAGALKEELRRRGTFMVNLMGSPGAGKTSLLAALLPLLAGRFRPAVIEADLDSRVDADALEAKGWRAAQLRTGGFCHLDAFMVRRGLAELGLVDETDSVGGGAGAALSAPGAAGHDPGSAGRGRQVPPYDLVFIENVGNLICTAQVDTGAAMNLALLSVPEGDDKPLKYPPIFAMADAIAVTKADYLDREAFDLAALRGRVAALKPDSRVIAVSARSGEGLAELAEFIAERAAAWLSGAAREDRRAGPRYL
jgi:hydrogenase nickel incorporation protein HypB